MTDASFYLTMAMCGLAAISIVTLAALRGWRWWLDYKKAELQHVRMETAPTTAASRIEIADLRERIRKLEAIAAGVDL